MGYGITYEKTTKGEGEGDGGDALIRIRLTMPSRYYQLPLVAFCGGFALGCLRASRTASLQFLAENVHRAPRTLRGWYLYRKTKNYRVALAGLKGGGKEAIRLGLAGVAWVGGEVAMEEVGAGEFKEIGAGLLTASAFAVAYRMPLRLIRQSLSIGLVGGGTIWGLRRGQGWMKTKMVDEENSNEGSEQEET